MGKGKGLRRWLPAAGVLAAGVLAAVWIVDESLAPGMSRQSRELVEQAVRRAAVQCYAIEGAYPVTLAELRDRYGVQVDEERWMVDYRYVADNLTPDITVIARE